MTTMRDKIDSFIAAWETKAKNAMYLDDKLHKKIRAPLVDGLVALIEAELAGQKPVESAPKAKRAGASK